MLFGPGEAGGGIAVFPFLKTSEPVSIGSFIFRSTDDPTDLAEEDAKHVTEIAGMLFLRDDLRIRSASYAMLPPLRDPESRVALQELENIQSIIAYCYSAPRFAFGDTFLTFEHAGVAIFSPEPVLIAMVRPQNHVELISESTVEPHQTDHVPGYHGWYNFRQPFWVISGSRLYPPLQQLALNISQDLAKDVSTWFGRAPQHRFLMELLRQPTTAMATRVLTSLAWYNRANTEGIGDDAAILNLAIGFEALLSLPEDAKSDRFKDAVSLILGRVPRLDVWADQFYKARCRVAHEGRAEVVRFIPADDPKRIDWRKCANEGPFYQSLIAYGRQIFQLCVGTLMFGAHLAFRSGLPEKLETNQERFVQIHKTLGDQTLSVEERFAAIDRLVSIAATYQFAPESIHLDTILGAAQAAARTLLASTHLINPDVNAKTEKLASANRSSDWYDVLTAVETLHTSMTTYATIPDGAEGVMYRFVELIWRYTFTHYFRLSEERRRPKAERATT